MTVEAAAVGGVARFHRVARGSRCISDGSVSDFHLERARPSRERGGARRPGGGRSSGRARGSDSEPTPKARVGMNQLSS